MIDTPYTLLMSVLMLRYALRCIRWRARDGKVAANMRYWQRDMRYFAICCRRGATLIARRATLLLLRVYDTRVARC